MPLPEPIDRSKVFGSHVACALHVPIILFARVAMRRWPRALVVLFFVLLRGKHTMKNVFEAITQFGHDEDFVPRVTDDFLPTEAPAGSPEKIEALARRVQAGVPLWHPEDRCDYSGLTGAVRPRE